ncbi:MAG: NAD(P) transhydrogenase subunit alpha [Proteobacteria bacterium]|nr:NAD(P) transhydrogenase subunit alpha [Pseudomonadota bacterium]
MRVAIPKEITDAENRVALVPALVADLTRLGCTVLFENGAGAGACYPDELYQNVTFYSDPAKLYQDADIVLKVEAPFEEEVAQFKENTIVIGLLSGYRFPERIAALSRRNITSFAMELVPRISRAQSMDALSSQATIVGYKAVLIAANMTNRFFPMLTTAAGTIRPSEVLVIGAGVAGLQAIATAKRLGAIVKAYDIRTAAREQIESLGAKMINIDVQAEGAGGYARELTDDEKQKQQTVLLEAISRSQAIISTALIPGKPAPKIITTAMVEAMAPGSVIVDCAAIAGGNCELTQPDKTISHQGILINGPTNIPSMVAKDASNMYAKNLTNFLALLVKDGKLNIDWQDEILSQSVLTHQNEIKHQPTRNLIAGAS